jgi:uncharacterized membrane protein
MSPRTIAAGCLALAALASSCVRPIYQSKASDAAPAPATVPAVASAKPAAAAPEADLFATSVRPILQAHCSPCHFPGGTMYDRLPFDRGETLASHREGALRRLKGDDRAAFEAWLKTLP